MKLNILADTHNTFWLKQALDKYDNLISLGDVAAVDTKEYLKHKDWYGLAWKFYSKKVDFCPKNILDWFKKLNVNSWKEQLKQIKKSNKSFYLNFGNSDLRMIEFFSECKKELDLLEKENLFQVFQKPKILDFENIQLFFLPFTYESYSIANQLKKLNQNKNLFILSHCPVYQKCKKPDSKFYYMLLKEITKIYTKKIYYFHGHIHSDDTYIYSIKDFKNVIFITPKATDSKKGQGSFNHIVSLDSLTGKFNFYDLTNSKKINYKKLPKKYSQETDHWNNF